MTLSAKKNMPLTTIGDVVSFITRQEDTHVVGRNFEDNVIAVNRAIREETGLTAHTLLPMNRVLGPAATGAFRDLQHYSAGLNHR